MKAVIRRGRGYKPIAADLIEVGPKRERAAKPHHRSLIRDVDHLSLRFKGQQAIQVLAGLERSKSVFTIDIPDVWMGLCGYVDNIALHKDKTATLQFWPLSDYRDSLP